MNALVQKILIVVPTIVIAAVMTSCGKVSVRQSVSGPETCVMALFDLSASTKGQTIRTRYLEEYKRHYRNTWSWVNTILDETSGTNVLTFMSGMGDGYYPCHIG